MGSLMDHPALHRKSVIGPNAFDLNERPSALAEAHMLEAGKRQKL
jgi:hypothetical protein